ncbi:TetR/AcrR family transcriptional regulator C-terminal domain-containing protein [Kribbella sp. CA-294648]|uniref:TetR/AcrR family transcriptional regulator C-terminal domain-containing protein n=1 Tax=Kribbella sp. CA-294648 TaxID=3239948 RepID=UPI003D8AE17A
MAESIWTRSRAAAPARKTLNRSEIVKVAIELLDEEGLAGLSVRKLAAKLASGATSLYWYVETKDDLIDLVIDEIWGEIDVPDPALAGWRNGALLFGHSLRAAVIRHPWLPEVMYTRPSIGPNAMKLGARGLTLFGAAGFTGNDLDYAMGSVMAYTLGTASAEVSTREISRKSGQSLTEWAEVVMQEAEATADDDMRESIRRRVNRDIDTTLSESFTFGLEALLDGLEAKVKKTR